MKGTKHESEWTRKVLKILKMNEGWVVVKHADLFTVGVPDVSATFGGYTTWLENKDITIYSEWTPYKHLALDTQMVTTSRLARAGRCVHLITSGPFATTVIIDSYILLLAIQGKATLLTPNIGIEECLADYGRQKYLSTITNEPGKLVQAFLLHTHR